MQNIVLITSFLLFSSKNTLKCLFSKKTLAFASQVNLFSNKNIAIKYLLRERFFEVWHLCFSHPQINMRANWRASSTSRLSRRFTMITCAVPQRYDGIRALGISTAHISCCFSALLSCCTISFDLSPLASFFSFVSYAVTLLSVFPTLLFLHSFALLTVFTERIFQSEFGKRTYRSPPLSPYPACLLRGNCSNLCIFHTLTPLWLINIPRLVLFWITGLFAPSQCFLQLRRMRV